VRVAFRLFGVYPTSALESQSKDRILD